MLNGVAAMAELLLNLWGTENLLRDEPAGTNEIDAARRRCDIVAVSISLILLLKILLLIVSE